MCLRNPLADGKAESEATALRHSRPRAIGAPEALENMRDIGGGDSNSRVAHRERHGVGMDAEAELYLAAGGRVLDRIRYEIEKKLPQASRVSHYRDIRGERKVDGHTCTFAEYHRSLVDILHKWLERDGLAMDVEPTLVSASKREQTFNQVGHSGRLLKRF